MSPQIINAEESPRPRFDQGIISDKIGRLKIFDQVSEKYNISLKDVDPWFEFKTERNMYTGPDGKLR
jgi:hypothetical protein